MTSTAYPPTPTIQRIRFWLSFLAGLVGFGYLLLLGGYTFRGSFTIQLIGFGLALTLSLAWLIWRGLIWRDRLPRTGLEIPLGLGLLAAFTSLAFSPDIRQGLSRVGWLVAYIILFYFFLNLMTTDLDRWGLLAGVITVAGLGLLQAVLETYYWYLSWFSVSGGFVLPPTQYRFTGLLTSSIPLMVFANLFLPVVLVIAWRIRKPVVRVMAGIWLVVYILSVPFSSARGAWLGAACALASLLAFWLWEQRAWEKILAWPVKRIALAGLAAIFLLAAGGWLGAKFLVAFASHPSHGNDPFGTSGRGVIWQNALNVWKSSPWVGVGPGRFAFEYLRQEPSIPPGFWAAHAHDIFLGILAEFGILGLGAGVFLLGSLMAWGYGKWIHADRDRRPWKAAFLAAFIGLLVELVFDDLSTWMAVMVPAVFLFAWLESNSQGPMPAFPRISIGWLAIPAAVLLFGAGYGIWAYLPYTRGIESARAGNWQEAAAQADASVDRDPNFHFYLTEAGILWAWEWKFYSDPQGLVNARHYFERSLRLEPAPSWIWADLAVLEAASGDLTAAMEHMQQATRLSPRFAPYALTLGKLFEQSGDETMAQSNYLSALSLKPEMADLDFWTSTPFRRQVLAKWESSPSVEPGAVETFWQKARQAVLESRLDDAGRLLAQSRLLNESGIDQARVALLLDEARGDAQAVAREQAAIKNQLALDQMVLDIGAAFTYPAFLAERDGIGIIAVPGLGE